MTVLAIVAYNICFIKYHMKLLNLRFRTKFTMVFFSIIMSAISVCLITNKVFIPYTYLITYISYFILLKIIFIEDVQTIAVICMYNIFQLNITRDIVIGIFTIILGTSMFKLIQSYDLYLLSFAVCRIVMLLQGVNYEKMWDVKTIKTLLINKSNLKMMNLMIFGLVIILLDSNYTYYYAADTHTTTTILIINRFFMNFCFYFAIKMGIKSINWVEEEVLHKALALEVKYQKKIKESSEELKKLIKIYNHDFKGIINNVCDIVGINKIKNADKIIQKFDYHIKNVNMNNKEFSNNSLVNAMLNRLDEKCSKNGIKFTSQCYIPDVYAITDIELVRIFNNLITNAYEACRKQQKSENRWIKFKSFVKDNNLLIYQNNSFNGEINLVNNKLISTKSDTINHGIGVESIKHIVEEVYGVTFIDFDRELKEFKFLIKIPLIKEEGI